jgi:LPS-assembly protein
LPDTTGGALASSDWLFAATGQPLTSLYVDAAVQYSQTDRTIVNSAYTLRYTPALRQNVSVSKRFTKDAQHAVDVAWQWRLGGNHALLGKVGYSLGVPSVGLAAGTTDTLLGYEYDAGCWVFRVAAKRYVNTANIKSTSFSVQLDLSGLTQAGGDSGTNSGSLNVLKQNVPNYTPFDGAPNWTYDPLRPFEK